MRRIWLEKTRATIGVKLNSQPSTVAPALVLWGPMTDSHADVFAKTDAGLCAKCSDERATPHNNIDP